MICHYYLVQVCYIQKKYSKSLNIPVKMIEADALLAAEAFVMEGIIQEADCQNMCTLLHAHNNTEHALARHKMQPLCYVELLISCM